MPDLRVSGITAESNRLYETINHYYNIYAPKIIAALMSCGAITEPPEGELPLLTAEPNLPQNILAEFFAVLAKEQVGNRSHERNIASIDRGTTVGYSSTTELISDLPNVFREPYLTTLTNNFTQANELFSILDGCSMGKSILDIWNDVIRLHNKLYQATRVMQRV